MRTGSALAPPKIFLETATSRTVKTFFALNIFAFIIGFSLDLYASLNSFTNDIRYITNDAVECNQINNFTNIPGTQAFLKQFSCPFQESKSQYSWIGHITDVANVIAFKLSVIQQNVSSSKICTNQFSSEILTIEARVYACYKTMGCSGKDWHHVLTQDPISYDESKVINYAGRTATLDLVPSTFQNQPSLASKGIVRSYLITVQYTYHEYQSVIFDGSTRAQYTFQVISGQTTYVQNIFLQILLCVTVIGLFMYSYELFLYRYTEPIPRTDDLRAGFDFHSSTSNILFLFFRYLY